MFLSDKAQLLIDGLRGEDGDAKDRKASICDAMSIIIQMNLMYASNAAEKAALIDTLEILAVYNELVTELSKEKEI